MPGTKYGVEGFLRTGPKIPISEKGLEIWGFGVSSESQRFERENPDCAARMVRNSVQYGLGNWSGHTG